MARLETLGRYEIVSELGQGAMGTVYKAIDPRLDRTVALKTVRLDPHGVDYAEFRERFHAEAKSAGRLSHPNIVTIHDFGEVDGIAYIAMEFLRGETLRHMLDRQRFSVRRAVRYAAQIADGLAAAHADGVVHRDIKPANVLRLSNGLLKITDFGIAQLPTSHVTQAGTLLGTPKYMSPEQMRSMRVDRRSDVFSLGVCLYEMLTGTLPFGGASLSGVGYQIVHDKPIHPNRWNQAIPEPLVRILAKCLEKDPDNRYQSMVDLVRDLRHYQSAPVALDADVGRIFLPLDPSLQPPANPLPAERETPATDDWLVSTVPIEHARPAEDLEPFSLEEARMPPLPQIPIGRPRVPAQLTVGLFSLAIILFGGAIYAVQRQSSTPAEPARVALPDAAAANAPANAPPGATAAAVAPAATTAALAPADPAPLPDAAPAADAVPNAALEGASAKSQSQGAAHPVARKPKTQVATGVVSPVLLPQPEVEPIVPQAHEAPHPSEAEIAAGKRAAEAAAFQAGLRKERDCLVSNRCE